MGLRFWVLKERSEQRFPIPRQPAFNQQPRNVKEGKEGSNLLHISLRYEPDTTSGLLTVHEQPSILLVVDIQYFFLLDGQFSGVRGVVIVECLDDRCMLVLPGGKISNDGRNATEDQFRTGSTYAAGTRPTGASSSSRFGLTFHQLRRTIGSQMKGVGKRSGGWMLNSSSTRSTRKRI